MHNWPEIIMAVVAVIGVVMGIVAWIYRRGKYEQELRDALKENTTATKEVSGSLKEFRSFILTELTDLKIRVAVLEKK